MSKTPGLYKEGKYYTYYRIDGTIISAMPNPIFDDIEKFESLPEGLIKSQDQLDAEYQAWYLDLLENSEIKIMDFGE